jgi:hypothetical protein|nr:MAG TPA: hypothetical protein [Caudoviricetes sp.]
MALQYGRIVARFATFQDGHTPVGTVEFVPSGWLTESGIIHSPAPVIGYVREDGQLYGSEKAYASETPGVKLLVSDPKHPARYTATPRLYDPVTGAGIPARAFDFEIRAGATGEMVEDPSGGVRVISSNDGLWTLEVPAGASIVPVGDGAYAAHGLSVAAGADGTWVIGKEN